MMCEPRDGKNRRTGSCVSDTSAEVKDGAEETYYRDYLTEDDEVEEAVTVRFSASIESSRCSSLPAVSGGSNKTAIPTNLRDAR